MLKERAILFHKRGCTVAPFFGIEMFEWGDYRNVAQRQSDIEEMDWHTAIGISIIAGSYRVNDVKAYKFSSAICYNTEAINKILKEFGLPENYPWVIKSSNAHSIEIIAKSDYMEGVALVRGTWRLHRVHICMEGSIFVPETFVIPKISPATIERKDINRFLHSMTEKQGLHVDINGHYVYYK